MNKAKLETVKIEIDRFMSRADDYVKEKEKIGSNSAYETPKESGALRRASLDLTRALAKFRSYK